MERLKQLRADVEAWVGRLSPRERTLVGAAAARQVVYLRPAAQEVVPRAAVQVVVATKA